MVVSIACFKQIIAIAPKWAIIRGEALRTAGSQYKLFVNLHHAAVLAFVGWYLMLPPMQGGRPNESAPLSQWVIIESFNTAKECNMLLQADAESRTHFMPATEPLLQASAAECI